MFLFLKSLPRLVRSANKDAARHFSMTFSSILSIAIALFIVMLMSVTAFNLNRFASSIESEFVVQVSLQPTLTDEQKEQVGSSLSDLEGVGTVTYSSKEQELDKLISENGDIFAQYRDHNPLFDTYTIQLSNAEQVSTVSAQAEKITGVAEVSYGGDTISKLSRLFWAVRTGGLLVVLFMILLAIFLTRTSVKMAIHLRRDEIAIMRQVGAYNWYIQTPFLLEGMMTGFWGSLLPAAVLDIGYPMLYKLLNGEFLSAMFPIINPWPFCLWITLLLFGIGLITGVIGSYMAVRKYLKWIR